MLAYLDDRYQRTGQPPSSPHFRIENGHVVETEPGFLFRHPWLIPVIGVSAGLLLPFIAGGAGAGAAGGAAAATGAGGTAGGAGGAVGADVALETAAGLSGGTVGAGSAAGGATAAGAGFPWGDVIRGGIGAGAQLAGAQIQSTGIREAAEIQAAYLREALAYEKQRDTYLQNLEQSRYNDLSGRLQPYIATGQTANDRMAALLGLPTATHGYTPPSAPGQIQGNAGVLPTSQPSGAPALHTNPLPDTRTLPDATMSPPAAITAPATSPYVFLQAPDGTTKQVPAAEAQHWIGLGARPVGGYA